MSIEAEIGNPVGILKNQDIRVIFTVLSIKDGWEFL
jgi:hypothetical protein